MTNWMEARYRCTTLIVGVVIAIILCIPVQVAWAQEQPAGVVPGATPLAGISSFAPYFASVSGKKAENLRPVQFSASLAWNTALETANLDPVTGPRRITLDEAQEKAAAAGNPLLRLAALGVEAAKQHRLGVQSDFFPKLNSTFVNVHFNKFLGQLYTISRPLRPGTSTFALPLFNKDETLVAVTALQPLTPLFKLNQVLKIARADERIARGKAGPAAAEMAGKVEQSYFELLIAQRQRKAAEANVKKVENKWLLASASATPPGLAEYETQWLEVNKGLVSAGSKVKEATAALNALLGWPLDTELELVVPVAFFENISAPEATELALQNNPEVIEAEQTVVKAQAASKLSKLDYVPDVAVTGGYAYQKVMPGLPADFSYVGVMASFNVFDFGKRERTVKERNAQLAMAETGLVLVKAKVAAAATKAYYELDRSRQLMNLARRMNEANRIVEVKYEPEEALAARANSEAAMLQAELEYRMAFSRLQQLIGTGR